MFAWTALLCRWCELGREEPLKVLQPTFFFKLMVAIVEHLDMHHRAGELCSAAPYHTTSHLTPHNTTPHTTSHHITPPHTPHHTTPHTTSHHPTHHITPPRYTPSPHVGVPSGADLSQYAVSCQALLDDDRVTELAADATVQFLLKAGYEHVARRVGSDLK